MFKLPTYICYPIWKADTEQYENQRQNCDLVK